MIFRQARTGPCSVRTLADRHFQDHPPKGQRWPTTYMKKKIAKASQTEGPKDLEDQGFPSVSYHDFTMRNFIGLLGSPSSR